MIKIESCMTNVGHMLLGTVLTAKLQLAENALPLLHDSFHIVDESFKVGTFCLERREAVLCEHMMVTHGGGAEKAGAGVVRNDFEL